jgi:hypothetical protein
MMPFACAASRAAAIWRAASSASGIGSGTACEDLCEIFAAHQFPSRGNAFWRHHGWGNRLREAIDAGDVGMIESCKDLGLALEACQALTIARQVARQDLIATSRSRVVSMAFQT